jgi:hypothetical protein
METLQISPDTSGTEAKAARLLRFANPKCLSSPARRKASNHQFQACSSNRARGQVTIGQV